MSFIMRLEEELTMYTKMENKLRRNIKLDYLNTFITNLNMQSSIWVLYLAYCGLSLAEIGLVEGIYHATSILCEIPSGAVADLLGRKKSMVLSKICIMISCLIMLFARSFWLFALSFAIQSLGNNFNSGSEEALVYDSMKGLGREEEYMRVNGRLDVLIEVAQGIATVLGGVLAEYSYFWCYGACLVIAALALFPVLLMMEAPYTDGKKERVGIGAMVAEHFHASVAIFRADRRIGKVIIYYSVIFTAETVFFFYSQQYYSELGYNKIQISLILLIVGICSCAGAVLSERIFRRAGRKTGFVAAVVIGAAMLCYGLGNIVLSAAVFAAAGFCNAMLYPVQSDQLNRLIPSRQRATLISVNSMCFSVGMILVFPLAGGLADCFGLTGVLGGLGMLLLVFAVLWNRKK